MTFATLKSVVRLKRLHSSSDDSTIRVWDIEAGQPQFILQGVTRFPSIAYGASRQRIAAGNANGTATI